LALRIRRRRGDLFSHGRTRTAVRSSALETLNFHSRT
jgi:hypothetical protein